MLTGKVKEGLDILRISRNRYDGRIRNPFNEYECGHWYARALASYGYLQCLTGLRYDANEISMLMNARIQVDFHILDRLVSKAIAEIMNQTGSEIVVHKKSAFAPGYPRPTHRITI